MWTPFTRRSFVSSTLKTGVAAGLADLAFLHNLPALSAEETRISPALVQFQPDVEPLVRLIEDTPRSKLIEALAERIRKGASYQQLLAAVFLAGIRNVQPRPVGFKFHAVLVIHSAHQAALAAQDRDRWLPLFWAADNFKASQARNKVEGDWHMPAIQEGKLPPASRARADFMAGMDQWDEDGADRGITSLVRSAGAAEIFELFWLYGARDFRDIGHKAIYAANAFRTLQTIGWRHAEPVLRSLAYAMLDRGNSDNPAKHDYEADRPGRENHKRAASLKGLPPGGLISPEATRDLLHALREASYSEASQKVEQLLRKGVHPDSIWDGIFLRCGELLMQQPGIGGLHTVTTANALHFAYQMSRLEGTRRFLMLQAAAYLPLFKNFMASRGSLARLQIDTLEPVDTRADLASTVEGIFAQVGKENLAAAQKTLAVLNKNPQVIEPLMAQARRLIFLKGTDSHDYKFSSAALEDYYHLHPTWRARFAASSLFWLKGSAAPDNDLIRRTRDALARS